jgi:glutamate racemase
MAIGVFDSGIGGLSVHQGLAERLPRADLVYLADQAHVPYGTRSGGQIVELTRLGCERLFAEGCDLVILACNTASAVALRTLQQQWLHEARRRFGRSLNVLGIVVPTIEVITGRPWNLGGQASGVLADSGQLVGLFATEATVRTGVYEIEVAKRRPDLAVVAEPCPALAGWIEQGEREATLAEAIEAHFAALVRRAGRVPARLILGSTHYEVVAGLFRRLLPAATEIVRQPPAVAAALEAYLARHGEFDPGRRGLRRFLTTGRPGVQNGLAQGYGGGALSFEAA